MITKEINKDSIYAQLIELGVIYEQPVKYRNGFLEQISYNPEEITAMMEIVSDSKFRNWIESSIPVMQCRKEPDA
jgi:hypothetical protein